MADVKTTTALSYGAIQTDETHFAPTLWMDDEPIWSGEAQPSADEAVAEAKGRLMRSITSGH